MVSKAQEKLIRSLHRKKARRELNKCLVEGKKLIDAAGDLVEFVFTRTDTDSFDKLVTTQTPQGIAGVARVPQWNIEDVEAKKTIVVLDGVQDPGNVGAIFRACLGFDASLVMIESADATNTKVVRSSAGALFGVPWIEMNRKDAMTWLAQSSRDVLRLENKENAIEHHQQSTKPAIIIAGSEGSGIQLTFDAPSLRVSHQEALESLNVAQAVTVVLAFRR